VAIAGMTNAVAESLIHLHLPARFESQQKKKQQKGSFSSTHTTITSNFFVGDQSFFTCHTCQRKLLYLGEKSHFSF
jgi:hypothetical protein